ncbi:hypothetical protein A3F58_02575 [Candidatus Roizmanbacteria bacterium RIFCSPHIGHO2_12_FULL_37_9b]|uniref:Nudix hydrolase domain-containing protein n=1 Tax=Candidatus Roizmanbacteria bacterium RIFCSPHIGHO2_02_FULL_38_11 TaxID=1802039 RepID=A0A1F7GX32_9BACT|nr:MAG: hypothetical protein A3C25_06355 [Candidatus Roizmanbacteria bacterium RIFCSPHIGHO2_02_FULL_38_11]OGK35163.1 MAG: hypothetical protein A3F58_02575 [Candidatus Roizmanbacteria bacterium RIFCSPHIGHO2_12_FULL_37_9b]
MKKVITPFVVGLIKHKNKYLLTKRQELDPEDPADFVRMWQIPGGGINFGETVEKAILREIEEELDIKIKIVCIVPYIINSIRKTWQGIGIIFLCKPSKKDFKIRLNSEASAYGWFTYEEIIKLDLLPGGKEAIKAAILLVK